MVEKAKLDSSLMLLCDKTVFPQYQRKKIKWKSFKKSTGMNVWSVVANNEADAVFKCQNYSAIIPFEKDKT